ncbi:MAG: tRNA uridine-5-carboxymethylaminomethyl(34) synthesis GTPase MnmE [Deltaproteobacteria bacterium]|nr:tRNA uridine-5-carboxymethylaminomethyl(34) synthesis GTPase MnmE [Deltaproteobacteria bacterium]
MLDLACRDTIAALLTGNGDGVINAVRVSGPGATGVRDAVFLRARPGRVRPATLHLGRVQTAGGALETLCATFPGPRSYTGETCVELHGPGGRVNGQRLLQAVLGRGARQAQPGEFTLRAFLHGRLTLDQAEAVGLLLQAQSAEAAVAAERLRTGEVALALEPVREAVLGLLAETEAYLDFPEDGLPRASLDHQREAATRAAAALRALLRGHERTRRMLEGARVVLYGAPNAGKSALFNALCGRDRAIVDDAPGTTRDVVEASVTWEGMPVTLVDTAGTRVAAGRVEQEGVRRSLEEAARADLLLYCVGADDGGRDMRDPPPGPPVIVVETKGDLASSHGAAPGAAVRLGTAALTVSARVAEGLPALRRQIVERLSGRGHAEGVVAATARQAERVACAAEELQGAVRARDAGEPEEVVAERFRRAASAIGEVSGRVMPTEEVLGAIFGRFCIGK